ncbi:MAG: glutamine amidotransferase [Alphaproteobacteria bacterium]|jgi:GMP synthase (glutamine-hydrolysing)|nr:glutamine amidotransferase [Alphaproteobacteria bacterium]MDP7221682.1 glutamine amidotransferase [Alphaproteobacteria bacterium]
MKVTVFQHNSTGAASRIGDLLEKKGATVNAIHCYHEDFSDFDPYEPDLLISMGGPAGVYQSHLYPFLDEELKFLEKRIEADLPTLGICLGAQLLAKTLGAECFIGTRGFEFGWHDLRVTKQGMLTPIKHFSGAETSMFHSHSDTFDLPAGATLLASSALYENQIFSYGKNILAMQCHPEMTERQVHNLLVNMAGHSTVIEAFDVKKFKREMTTNYPKLVKQTELFLQDWLELTGLAS